MSTPHRRQLRLRDLGDLAGWALPPLAGVAALLTGLLLATGWIVTSLLDGGWDLRAERSLADGRTPVLDALATGGTWLAETIPVTALTIVAVVVAARVTRGWTAPALIALAVGGEKLVYLVVSVVVARPRPPVETLGSTYATHSFPSGHVGSAICLYGSIALAVHLAKGPAWLRHLAVAVAVVAPVIVGLCRMYRGFHYPTDVLAGALLGALWLAATWAATRNWAAEVVVARRSGLHRQTEEGVAA